MRYYSNSKTRQLESIMLDVASSWDATVLYDKTKRMAYTLTSPMPDDVVRNLVAALGANGSVANRGTHLFISLSY